MEHQQVADAHLAAHLHDGGCLAAVTQLPAVPLVVDGLGVDTNCTVRLQIGPRRVHLRLRLDPLDLAFELQAVLALPCEDQLRAHAKGDMWVWRA